MSGAPRSLHLGGRGLALKPGGGDETAFLVTLLLGVALPQAARRPWHQHLAGLVPPYPVPFTALGRTGEHSGSRSGHAR